MKLGIDAETSEDESGESMKGDEERRPRQHNDFNETDRATSVTFMGQLSTL